MTEQSPHFTDALIERMLVERAGPGAPADLVTSIAAAIGSTGQRSQGLLGALSAATSRRSGPARERSFSNRMVGFAAVALAVAVVATGAGLFLRQSPALIGGPSSPPSIAPMPSSSVAPSPSPSPSPIATPRPAALIAYINPVDRANFMGQTGRVWIVGADGGGGHELFPDGIGAQSGAAWSPDGTRLIFSEMDPGGRSGWTSPGAGTLYLTDASGSEPQLVDTGCAACIDADADFSSDGTEIVFLRGAIATMDLASGRVVELSLPAAVWPEHPRWSPDGKQIVFSHFDKLRGKGSAVFIVDADGRNLRQLSSATLPARLPEWSPDGSRIVFSSYVVKDVNLGPGDYAQDVYQDVYTVRSDWTDLRRLTTDGFSSAATWTPDGRIMFTRQCTVKRPSAASDKADCSASELAGGLWTMDGDGSNAQLLLPGVGGQAAWQPTP